MKNAELKNYHPVYEFCDDEVSLPREHRDISQWSRCFCKTQPVSNYMTIYIYSSVKDFFLESSLVDVVDKYFDHFCRDIINVQSLMFDMSSEFWKFGNVFPYIEFDDNCIPCNVVVLNSDYVILEQDIFGNNKCYLIPDNRLCEIVANKKPKDVYNKIPKEIIERVKKNERILLSDNRVSNS